MAKSTPKVIDFWNNIGIESPSVVDSALTERRLVDPSEGPLQSPMAWDTLTIAGVRLPGIVDVRIIHRRRFDHKTAPGSDGASPTIVGLSPANIDINIRLWTADQFALWQSFMDIVWPPAGRTAPPPLDAHHPLFVLYRIHSLVIEEISGPHPTGDVGVRMVTMKCVQFVRPKPVKGKASPTGAVGNLPTALDPFTGLAQSSLPPAPISAGPGQDVNYQPANAQPPLPSQDPNATGP